MLETIEQYISPELVVLIPVLFLVGMALKRFEGLADRYIPFALGGFAIMLAMIYEFSTVGVSWTAVYISMIQGILCAGASVYAHQAYKQLVKEE